MAEIPSEAIQIPKLDEWPGTMGAYRLVKPYILPQIWNILGAVGLGILIAIVIEIIFGSVFKDKLTASVFNDLIGIAVGAFVQAVVLTMYFASIRNHEFTFNTAVAYGLKRVHKMLGLLIVMYVILVVSFVLLIVPFFFVLPRVYLAPYFLVHNDCSVSEAIAASWHSTKANEGKVYGIILLDVAIALLVITIIGIPFAIYFGTINSASFALLALYLSQSKSQKTKKAKVVKVS
jgi:hypothetical protein